MKICIAGRATRQSLAEALAECLRRSKHHVCMALIGPRFSVADFLTAVEDAEIVIILLEGFSREPWLMALEVFGSGKFVLCMASSELTAVEEKLLGMMSKNITIIPRSSPEHIVHEVLPHFFERWGFRKRKQRTLQPSASS